MEVGGRRRYKGDCDCRLRDADPAVRLEAAGILSDEPARLAALFDVLTTGAAADAYLRYAAAWQLAKVADAATLRKLVRSDDANLRLAGLIAIDVACYESLATQDAARAVLGELLTDPAPGEWDLPLTLARLNKAVLCAKTFGTFRVSSRHSDGNSPRTR